MKKNVNVGSKWVSSIIVVQNLIRNLKGMVIELFGVEHVAFWEGMQRLK